MRKNEEYRIQRIREACQTKIFAEKMRHVFEDPIEKTKLVKANRASLSRSSVRERISRSCRLVAHTEEWSRNISRSLKGLSKSNPHKEALRVSHLRPACMERARELGYQFGSFAYRYCPRISGPHREAMRILDELEVEYECEKEFGHFTVDIYIPSAHLVVEIDGRFFHAKMQARDKARDEWLTKTFGLRVVRVWEDELEKVRSLATWTFIV